MRAIQSLRLALLPGGMPTFYSPHAERRARYLQALLGGEIHYYSDQFRVRFAPVTMAVLNAAQWPQVVGEDPLASEIFWTQGLDVPHPFTKLSDFESKYDELEQQQPANYGWYQLALDQRVIEIHRGGGLQFLESVRSAFPKHGPKLDTTQVLAKLEMLSPGWKSWSMRVEAGDVEAVKLEPANRP